MINAIAYTRVSSQEQVNDGNSLHTQRRIISEFAQKKGYNVVEWFVEEGESAKTANRTQLTKMMKYALEHKGEISTLLIYKVDRLSRNTSDYIALKEHFEKCGIHVYSVTEAFSDTPMGRLSETMASAFSQFDNENRAERCKGGMVDGVREGRWMWSAPIGYVNGRDTTGKRNIVLDNRGDIVEAVRSSWQLIATGSSETEARRIVNMRLKKAGHKPISRNGFSKMIKKKLYIGIVEGFGLEVRSRTIPPLIDEETFTKANDIISGNANLGKKYIKHNENFPLRGILYCKNGHKMTGSAPKGRTKRYPKYHCPHCKGQHTNYDVQIVNDKFLEYVDGIEMSRDVKDALRTAIKLNLNETIKNNEKERDELTRRLTIIGAEKKEVVRKNIQGVYSDGTTREIIGDYEKEETEIRLKLNDMDETTEDVVDLMEFGVEKLSNLADTFQEIDDPEIRFRFQKWLFPAGLVYDGEKFGTTKLPTILQIKRTALAGVSCSNSHCGDPEGSRTLDFLDENQTSWTTRRRDHLHLF